MIAKEQIPTVLDHPVYDTEGKKVGEARHVFVDDATGRPAWVTVKTGLFGTSESFVPIKDASMVDDHLKVPYPKDRIKDAPRVDVDRGGHLDAGEEQRLYAYYGIAWDDAWQRANRPGEGGWAHGTAGAAGRTGTEGRAGAENTTDRGTARTGRPTGDDAMTRSEEQMHVGTERVETGHVRLRKYVVTEEVQETVPVRHEEVHLEREPITDANREQALSGPEITEAEHEVTLHEERPVIETRAVPVERVSLRTDEVTEEETVTGQVRKERIDVETDDIADMPRDRDEGRDK
ncbi:DUF2382 domain-containing protein [Streptomyces vietnamensis]|uniref:Photosystem reaction center subunit H n=1 Tax=Streptomyces vietnamensis TaxID=362257 RepID=A0A0B5I9S1_9ACTN|nr:PRC and DUF2382 domain-containing protein [Streptomyces vietnamensis]AJF69291.1 photosystem reaction center subunit H [Streptomyces vietnamensis]